MSMEPMTVLDLIVFLIRNCRLTDGVTVTTYGRGQLIHRDLKASMLDADQRAHLLDIKP